MHKYQLHLAHGDQEDIKKRFEAKHLIFSTDFSKLTEVLCE